MPSLLEMTTPETPFSLGNGAVLPARKQPQMRDITDAPLTRRWIFNDVHSAASKLEPLENNRHRLELRDVRYEGPEHYSIEDRKKAILEKRSLNRKLVGTWVLKDKETGDPLDERRMTVARVPYLTDAGTFVHNGNEYTLSNQMRLRPGIFTRIKDNGEIESHVNILPGRGTAHRYFLDPERGVFYLRLQQAKIPIMPLVRALGATDKELQEAWGRDLYATNATQDSPANVNKLYERLVSRKDPAATREQKIMAIRDAISQMEIDPEVSQRTLGTPYSHLNLNSILATTRKLLDVSRGEADVDDRDHLAFQSFLGPEDLFSERLAKDYQGVRRKFFNRASWAGGLDMFQPGMLTRQIESALLRSGLGAALEEINPADVFDKQNRVSRMGEGGIPSVEAVPDEARAVQPSHYGYIDPLRTPECYDRRTEVFTRRGWIPWSEASENDHFACLINGRLEFHLPVRLIRKRYRGPMYGATSTLVDYLVTPNHRMWTRPYDYKCRNSAWRIELAEEMHGRNRRVLCGHAPNKGRAQESFELPVIEKGSNSQREVPPIPLDDWAEFLGWFLSEGHVTPESYVSGISQSQTANPDICTGIEELLDRLPFAWHYNTSMRCYVISGKQLANYLSRFGKCNEKWIPEEVFDWPVEARRRLLESLLKGDGRFVKRSGRRDQYCTTSHRLARDVQRLLVSLGISSCVVFEPDEREERYKGCWVVHIHLRTERILSGRIRGRSHYYVVDDFDDEVFCAEVPGGLLYVRRNERCGFWSGNSFKAGVDVYLSSVAKKGRDGRVYTPWKDVKTGEIVYKSPQELADVAIAFPGELDRPTKRVFAMHKGRTRIVPKDQVQLVPPHFERIFSPLGNMVPLKSLVQGQRMAMASRMMTQALPLLKPEAPLVQSGIPGEKDRSFEHEFGRFMGAVRASGPGRVVDVSPTEIKVRYNKDGRVQSHELYHNFPYNRKTYVHNTSVVAPGDRVEEGSLLAKSNYTDNDGVTALGLNARVAYIPFKGLNFEDAIAISESMAKRLSSEHMYQHRVDFEPDHRRSKNEFVGLFPGKYNRQQLDNIDTGGAIQPGTKVQFGDPLILSAVPRSPGHHKIHKRKQRAFEDRSLTWDHHQPGEVTDVVKTRKGTVVLVKSIAPMQVGDKLSGRYGDKGVISEIIPDDEMPHDRDGRPYEVLLNPLGIQTRANPAQVAEAVLGEIASKTGQPRKPQDFESVQDWADYLLEEIRKNDIDARQDLIDPQTGRKLPAILTGNRFFMKLHHMAEAKGQGRATGGYTMEELPARGGETGSKRISLMDTNALLSHGATQVLRDARVIRGQRNEDLLLAFMQGQTLPKPRVPLVFRKFVNELKGAGINVVPEGGQLHIMALTDHDVDELAGNREVTSGDTVRFEDQTLEPVKGGLFDPSLTGGHYGNRWSYIRLHEPMPSPVMEEPIRRLLNLTQKKFRDIIACRDELPGTGCGTEAIQEALSNINVKREIAKASSDVASGRKTVRDQAVRRLKYLKGAEKYGIHPSEWIVSKLPVLPPIFRPISVMQDTGIPIVSDANYLYKEAFDANELLKELSQEVEDVGDERLALYDAFKAVTGLGDPGHPKLQEKRVRGILHHIFGPSPKLGTIQRRLLSTPVDLVGRAVITPNPDLDMDSVGLPENRAWEIYRPFIVRRLKRKGLSLMEALRHAEDRTPQAREELVAEMDYRPVYISRAPVHHRFGIMAFWPRLVKGETLQVPPVIVKGFGADFDGDAMNYHVPMDESARVEAIDHMMPSANLLSPADFKTPMFAPSQEYLSGLFEATRKPKRQRPVEYFSSQEAAIRAYLQGNIPIDTRLRLPS